MTVNYTKITVGGQKVLDANLFFDTLSHRPEWADRINTLECPLGCEPGRGWFLMSRTQFDLLDIDDKVDVIWSYGVVNGGSPDSITFAGYVVTQAWEAVAADNSPMIIELADPRQIYANSATAKRYNVRRAVGYLFDYMSQNDGDTWTWDEMVEDLAGEIQDASGASFTLENAPPGTPENMLFDGVSAWHGLCEIAELTSHAVSYDPIDGEAKSHELCVTQPGVQSSISSLAKYRDLSVGTAAYGNAPENIRVFFHWRPGEGDNWNPRKPYHIDVATNIANASPGFAVAWSSMMAEPDLTEFDADPINLADLTAEATMIRCGKKDEFERKSQPDVYRFSGLRDLRPGSEIASVKWINDGGDTWTEIRMANNDQMKKRFPKYNEPFSASGYVIKPPEGGIPARSGETPGSANCDIYYVDPTNSELKLLNDTAGNPVKTKVYNLATTKSGTDYVQSIRDWQARWWAILASGTSGEFIRFRIDHSGGSGSDSQMCEDKLEDAPTVVNATVISRPCGATKVTGEDDDGKVEIEDRMNSFLSGREASEIDGKEGIAVYVQDDGEYECYWLITWIDWFEVQQLVHDVVIGEDELCITRANVEVWKYCELEDECSGTTCPEES